MRQGGEGGSATGGEGMPGDGTQRDGTPRDGTLRDWIEGRLREALAPESLAVIDESHLHAGHAGARPGGETHYRVDIVAAAFDGKSRVERQRLVNGLLTEAFARGLHALAMRTRAPAEAA